MEHAKIRKEKGLPQVGQVVKSKQYGTAWKIIEQREVWVEQADFPHEKEGVSHLVPGIALKYWRVMPNQAPGTGKTMEYTYTPHDNTFKLHWQIIGPIRDYQLSKK